MNNLWGEHFHIRKHMKMCETCDGTFFFFLLYSNKDMYLKPMYDSFDKNTLYTFADIHGDFSVLCESLVYLRQLRDITICLCHVWLKTKSLVGIRRALD